MSYIAGVDGGGTNTILKIADMNGKILQCHQFGSINTNGASIDEVSSNIFELTGCMRKLSHSMENFKILTVGSAGISNPKTKEKLENLFRKNGYAGKLVLVGDSEIALRGALSKSYGSIIISGTGSICFGKTKEGKSLRSGGWGHLIDDEGSGYAIGRDILTEIVRSFDGRSGETVFKNLVFEYLKIDKIEQLIQFVYDKETQKKDIAQISMFLSTALECGDASAEIILKKATDQLLILAKPVIEKMNLESFELAMIGGVLEKNQYIRKAFIEKIKTNFPNLLCINPVADPATGAVMIGLDVIKKESKNA